MNHFVKLLPTSAPDLQQYAVRKIFNIVRIEGEKSWIQEGLLQAMLWSVGEYGVLISGISNIAVDEDDVGDSMNEFQVAPSEKEVVDLIANILKSTSYIQEYALTGLIKLTA